PSLQRSVRVGPTRANANRCNDRVVGRPTVAAIDGIISFRFSRRKQETASGDQVSCEYALSVSAGVECVERLFGLTPKSRLVAVQAVKCAAIELSETQETVRQVSN